MPRFNANVLSSNLTDREICKRLFKKLISTYIIMDTCLNW